MPTIRELRNRAEWTQVQLAERVGVAANTVARWERGEVEPDSRSKRLLELVFGVPPDAILYTVKPDGHHSGH